MAPSLLNNEEHVDAPLNVALGLLQVPGKGLSGLVHAQLGTRLDKRPQCSSWSTRPLSQQQARADSSLLHTLAVGN